MVFDKQADMAHGPPILAVETSSRTGSVALALGPEMLAETVFSAPMRHSAEILPAVRELLARFSLEPGRIKHVCISVGPGSFTGLRIAATFAKTMHMAVAARIVAVDTLDVIAANVINLNAGETFRGPDCESRIRDGEKTAVILDAKRGQFFIAVYDRNVGDERRAAGRETWKKILPDSLMSPSHFLARFADKERPICLLGDGLLYYRDMFRADGVRFLKEECWSPRAGKVHLLGWQMALKEQFADPVTLTPNYVRTPDVTIKPR